MNAKDAFFHAVNEPDPDYAMVEGAILQDGNPEWAYAYASMFQHVPWKEAEPIIRKDPKWACLYALLVGKRWRALEHQLLQVPKYGDRYIKRFFPGCDPATLRSGRYGRSVDDTDDTPDVDEP